MDNLLLRKEKKMKKRLKPQEVARMFQELLERQHPGRYEVMGIGAICKAPTKKTTEPKKKTNPTEGKEMTKQEGQELREATN